MHPAPISVGAVTLTVRDLDGVRAFYEKVVGLTSLQTDGESASLGAGSAVLLRLERDTHARQSTPREAGLFHTAFLLPRRADLAAWLQHAVETNVRLQGASDHIVSEAMYLADPEGNGIEIYADRPSTSWKWTDGSVEMATDRLDIDDLMRAGGGAKWGGAPVGTCVGHVHLQVGDLAVAQRFYNGALGFDITTHYPGATFYSTGGYHHHIATNVWNSRGATTRVQPATGLHDLRLVAEPDALAALAKANGGAARDGIVTLTDPWGTQVSIKPR